MDLQAAASSWRSAVARAANPGACRKSKAVVSYCYWRSRLGGRELDSNTSLLIDGAAALDCNVDQLSSQEFHVC